MDWSFPNQEERFKTSLKEIDGKVTVTSLTKDGAETSLPEFSVESAGKEGMAIVNMGGSAKNAHIARSGDTWWVHFDGRSYEIIFHEKGSQSSSKEGSLKAPMPGTVLQVNIKQGQRVREGQHLMTLEAMKMEHKILAPTPGEISRVHFSEGDRVDMGSPLVEIED